MHAIKAYGGLESELHSFLTSALCRFTPRDSTPGAYWVGGMVERRGGLFALEKRKPPCSCRKSNRDSSVVQAVALSLPPALYWLGNADVGPVLKPRIYCVRVEQAVRC